MNIFQIMIIIEAGIMSGLCVICSVCFYKLGMTDAYKKYNKKLKNDTKLEVKKSDGELTMEINKEV